MQLSDPNNCSEKANLMKNTFAHFGPIFLFFAFTFLLILSFSVQGLAQNSALSSGQNSAKNPLRNKQTLCRFGEKKIRIEHSAITRQTNLRIKEPSQKTENFFTNRPSDKDEETLLVTPEQNQFVFFYRDSLQFIKLNGHKASWTSHEKTVQANCVKI